MTCINCIVSPESGVTVLPLDKIFQHEDNVTLTCNGLGGPGNQYNWTRRANGEITQGPLTPTFDLTPVMGGVYSCEVGNTAGVGSGTTTVFVSLRFILQPNNTLSEVGARAVLSCVAESFPTPKYQWFHVDGDIRNNLTGLNDSNLVLDPVQFGDEGDYFCVATSRTNFTGQSRSATLAGKRDYRNLILISHQVTRTMQSNHMNNLGLGQTYSSSILKYFFAGHKNVLFSL